MSDTKYKYYKYTRNVNITNRYKILTFKFDLKYLEELQIDGYKKIYSSEYSIVFKVDKKLLRKIKLLTLNKDINNSTNNRLLKIINNSLNINEEIAKKYNLRNSNYWTSYSSSGVCDDYEIDDKKNNFKWRARSHDLMVKNYGKTKWSRK